MVVTGRQWVWRCIGEQQRINQHECQSVGESVRQQSSRTPVFQPGQAWHQGHCKCQLVTVSDTVV